METERHRAFSAKVELFLQVGEEKLRVASTGPDSFCLRDERNLPPGTEGTLSIIVDGHATEYHVLLHRGALVGTPRVEYI